jgi:hypothetical protein
MVGESKFVLDSTIVVALPYTALDSHWEKLFVRIQEYDLDVNPTKTTRRRSFVLIMRIREYDLDVNLRY